MEFVQLKCPNCTADLEIENEIDSFYCKYCGTKIMINGQSDSVINAKIAFKSIETDLAKTTINQKAETTREAIRAEERKTGKKQKHKTVVATVGIIAIFIALSLFIISGEPTHIAYNIGSAIRSSSNNRANSQELNRLDKLYKEILDDMAKEDYDIALAKTAGLRYSLSTYGAEYSQWENTRLDLLKIIHSRLYPDQGD